jgi:sulfite dehydrogenase (quinone) subunit SoeC
VGDEAGQSLPAEEVKPAWSVMFFTTLAGAGQGLFLALFIADVAGRAPRHFLFIGSAVACVLVALGLVSSFFHLGRPERGWRAAAMWRTSWLSREVIVLPLFLAVLGAYSAAQLFSLLAWARVAGATATLLCLALFVCTGMIYVCLKFLQEWSSPLTVFNFFALGCASGATAAAALAAWQQPELARAYAGAALSVGAVAYIGRLASLMRNTRLRPKSTTQSAIGARSPDVRQISQGAMGGSYNTREFFHGRTRQTVRAVRWALLALVFPVPAALMLYGAYTTAFILQYAGLLAERWYFFAEARHPQNLYYQAIA